MAWGLFLQAFITLTPKYGSSEAHDPNIVKAFEKFIEKIGNKGLVWQNRYEVFITGPGGDASRDINLLAESVSMPGQNIRTTEDEIYPDEKYIDVNFGVSSGDTWFKKIRRK